VLPPTLDVLLGSLEVVSRQPVIVRGWGSDCGQELHHWEPWIEAIYRPVVPAPSIPVRITLSLRISVCTLCETIEVRDVSFDRLDGLPTGRLAPRRRDALLGWYSGVRRANRIYH
jgi:hypothetical protein